jgi:cofilin
MSSGVAVDEFCKQKYEEIKKGHLHRYIVFYIKDEKMITVEKIGSRGPNVDDDYELFLNDLWSGGDLECRYGLFDFEYEHQCQGTTGSHKQKLFLMSWCPDTAKVKKKMLYSSSFDALRKSLVGVAKCIQATDSAEASKSEVEKQLRATDRN